MLLLESIAIIAGCCTHQASCSARYGLVDDCIIVVEQGGLRKRSLSRLQVVLRRDNKASCTRIPTDSGTTKSSTKILLLPKHAYHDDKYSLALSRPREVGCKYHSTETANHHNLVLGCSRKQAHTN